jgi:hypothetical protein
MPAIYSEAFVFIVFTLELFLTCTHFIVLTHTKVAPRKVLVKQVLYFVIDMITPLISLYILRETSFEYLTFVGIHTSLHFYYIVTWNKAFHTKKIISWSSLEWKDKIFDIECFPLTCYDISVHASNLWLLSYFVPGWEILVAVSFASAIIYGLMFVKYNNIWTNRNDDSKICSRTKKLMTKDLNFNNFHLVN